jgi:maleate isomerase
MTQNTNTRPRRAGLLVPSSNTTLETDFLHQSPSGWSFHSARMYLEDISIHALARMVDQFALPAARDLASITPDVVVFGSASAAALRGNEYENQLITRIEQTVHTPVISPMKAARQELKNLHASRIAVITPYINEINQQIRVGLEQDDFKVLRIEGFSLTRCSDSAHLQVDQLVNLARLISISVQPDALFICGTNLPAMAALESLQEVLNYPVVTTNQAIIAEVVKLAVL